LISDQDLLDYCNRAYSAPNIECVNGAEAYIQDTPEGKVIAFAGTDSLLDVAVDMIAWPWKPSKLGCWVHRGVWVQALCLYEQIEPTLNTQDKLYITGHSLGGGLANVVTALLVKDGYSVERMSTFGSMKAGFKGLSHLTEAVPGERYVRDGDSVTSLPLSVLMFKYQHDRPALLLEGDEAVWGDHNLDGYEEALDSHLSPH